MTKLDQIRLAIYEKCEAGEITDAEKKTLLESAVEKYSEKEPLTDIEEAAVDSIVEGILTFTEAMEVINSDEEEAVEEGVTDSIKKAVIDKAEKITDKAKEENKVFVKSFEKLKDKYIDTYNNTRSSIKKDISDVIINVKECEMILHRMVQLIQHVPASLDKNAMSRISDNITTLIQQKSLSALISHGLELPSSLKDHMLNVNAIEEISSSAFKVIRTKEPNLFKADAIIVINREIVNLKRLEKKLEKVKN